MVEVVVEEEEEVKEEEEWVSRDEVKTAEVEADV